MIHPSEREIALFAGGDLPWTRRWRIGRHVNGCASCSADVEAVRAASASLQDVGLPAGFKWDRLAAEMSANIRVGLEAADCVAPARRAAPRTAWRAAAAMAGVSVLAVGAWWLNPPPRQEAAMRAPRVEIRTTSAGLEMEENGSAVVLLHGRGQGAGEPIIVSSPGSLRARYVDSETGQITINNVYAE